MKILSIICVRLPQRLSKEQAEFFDKLIGMITTAPEEEARKIIRSFEQNVKNS